VETLNQDIVMPRDASKRLQVIVNCFSGAALRACLKIFTGE